MLVHFRRARNLKRFQRIVSVLARHGFGSALEAVGVQRYIPLPPKLLKQRPQPSHLSPAEHLRLALEELGPTFIKLGQILSTRPDLFPTDFISELSKLQEHAPPSDWAAVRAVLEDEYDRPVEEVFAEIDPQPLGSASLAQVHAARLHDGAEVVVKVQRPKVQPLIEADLNVLNDLAHLAQRTAWGKLYDPVEIVGQFAYTLENELDYRREGVNADRFRNHFISEPHLYIPKVYWEQSTAHVLVLERLHGMRIDDLPALETAGIDRGEVARIAGRILVKEVMEDGFFHADPHPGNFLVMADEQWVAAEKGHRRALVVIAAMDFGMVGHVSQNDRQNMIQAYSLAARNDARGIVELMVRMGAIDMDVDWQALERDIARLLDQYRDLALQDIQTRRLLEELMQTAFQYRIKLPPDIWLLFKTLSMMDGLARKLDPDFDIFATLGPSVRRLMIEMRMPWVWGPSLLTDLEDLALALKDVPSMGEKLLRSMQQGRLPLSMDVGANRETLDRLDRISTRFSLSLLTTAFIIGLALLLPVASGNRLAMVLVGVGFLIAMGLGFWLAYSIIRSGR